MYIALDLETTGLNPQKNTIIEIAAIKMKPDGTILETFHSVVNPNVPIPGIITHITGITDEEVKDAPTFKELEALVQEFIGNLPILGHSIQFDVDFLNAHSIQTTGGILDTFQLAQTLLPKEPSYSLEILSEKYGLTHESKHRAEDDTKVAIELYKMLTERIEAIPQEIAEKILPLLDKSTWSWAPTFKEFLGRSPSRREQSMKTKPHTEPTVTLRPASGVASCLFELLTTHHSALIEDTNYTLTDVALAASHFTEQTGEQVIIATPTPEKIPTDSRVAHLEHPGRYLNQTRFDELIQKPHLSDAETRLAIKIHLWLPHTETGLKSELSVGDDEQGVWNQISEYAQIYSNAAPNENTFYGRAYKNAKYTPVAVIHSTLLIENIIRRAQMIPEKPHLIIESIESFEETALSALTNTFALDRFITQNEELKNRIATLFGLFEMVIEKYADQDAYNREMNLEQKHLATNEWAKIQATLNGIEEIIVHPEGKAGKTNDQSDVVAHEQFTALKKALALNPNILTWMSFSSRGEVVIRACPKQIGTLLEQMIWNKPETLIGLSPYGTFDHSFQFLKKRLHLNKELEEIIIPIPANERRIMLYVHDDLPNPNDPKNLSKTSERLLNMLEKRQTEPNADPDKNTGAIFLLTNSIKAIEQLHSKLITSPKAKPYNILGQGMSGGMGKIGQLFENNPDRALLIGTERLYKSLLKDKTAPLIDTLIIQKLPFQFPWQKVLKEETAAMENGFKDYSLPQAVLTFKKILHEFKTHTTLREIHLLDPRFENYDGHFMKSLPEDIKRAN